MKNGEKSSFLFFSSRISLKERGWGRRQDQIFIEEPFIFYDYIYCREFSLDLSIMFLMEQFDHPHLNLRST
jgi:hypothetical protein